MYIVVLDRELFPFMEIQYGDDDDMVYFQQDNAFCHTANHKKEWLYEIIVPIIDWPEKLPNLNPIENVWAMLVLDLYAVNRQFMDINHLKEAPTLAWDRLSDIVIEKMTLSPPKLCADVILKRRGPTSY